MIEILIYSHLGDYRLIVRYPFHMKILHIGYPKTGTTFLQSRIFGPLSIANKIPAYVGNDGRLRSRHRRDKVFLSLSNLGKRDFTQSQELNISSFLNSHSNFLISVEGILGNLEINLEEFSIRLKQLFQSDTEVVITVRDLDYYFDSWYQQRVKTDFVVSPRDFFFPTDYPEVLNVRKSTKPNFAIYDIDALVTALLKSFNTVTLIDARFSGYISWISRKSGIPSEEFEYLIRKRAKSRRGTNESLSQNWIHFLEIVNKVFQMIFSILRIRGIWIQLTQTEIHQLSKVDKFKYYFFLVSLKFKKRLQEIVRLLNKLNHKNIKYRLPLEIRREILNSIPESQLLVKVRNAGGILSLQNEAI